MRHRTSKSTSTVSPLLLLLHHHLLLLLLPPVSPTILVGEQVVGGHQGASLLLECLVEAWPAPLNYWEKDGRPIPPR